MAYHALEQGPTPVEIGWNYSIIPDFYNSYSLLDINQATGMCLLKCNGKKYFISATKLSYWYRRRSKVQI